ncbi:MAG: dihydroneopterin aldolase [Phycisphaerae bacterium]|nr:dihydroneopterin aldolase [Phycisphaerae bacterium]
MVIHIRNLRVHTIIGTEEWERHAPRELRVNVSLTPMDEAAAKSDELSDAVDYAELSERIVAAGKAGRFRLIEAFAAEVLRLVLGHPRVRSAEVEVIKPAALPGAESVAVSLAGTRPKR